VAPPRNRRRGGRPPFGAAGIARIALIGGGALVLLWLSVAVSVAWSMRTVRPNVALMLWPSDGLAKAELAEGGLIGSTDASSVTSLAEQAFEAEPTEARAARILALLSRDEQQQRARFTYSRQLSLRDLSTTIYFIETAVQRGDVRAALDQYDLALRASFQSAPRVLFPALDRALANDYLNPRIATMLAQSKDWPVQFVAFSLQNKTNVPYLARALALQPSVLGELNVETKTQLLSVLADQQAFDEAARIYEAFDGTGSLGAGIRNGTFAQQPQWPPFDWSIATSSEFGGAIVPDRGNLQVFSQGTVGGTVARQVVRLAPGRYRLAVKATLTPATSAGRLNLSVSCATGQFQPLGSISITGSAKAAGALTQLVEVPGECPWQWVILEVAEPSSETKPFEAFVDEVAIAPLPNS
jgi:hypothetical protein